MGTLWQDVRYAVRMLRKSPGFTGIALVTLAIGIGANTVMFSMSDLLLLHPRKVKAPEQLVFCAIQNALFPWFSYSAYLTVRDSGLAFSDLMAQKGDPRPTTLVHGDSVGQAQAMYVSANYFSFLGVAPAWGRGFLAEEERQGGTPVLVLSVLSSKSCEYLSTNVCEYPADKRFGSGGRPGGCGPAGRR